MPQGMEIRNKVEVVHLIIISDINSLILFKLSYIVLVMTEIKPHLFITTGSSE